MLVLGIENNGMAGFFSKAIIHLVSLSQDFFPSWATLTDMDPVNIIKIQIFTLETNV